MGNIDSHFIVRHYSTLACVEGDNIHVSAVHLRQRRIFSAPMETTNDFHDRKIINNTMPTMELEEPFQTHTSGMNYHVFLWESCQSEMFTRVHICIIITMPCPCILIPRALGSWARLWAVGSPLRGTPFPGPSESSDSRRRPCAAGQW